MKARFVLCALIAAASATTEIHGQLARVTDRDIVEAYQYMLGRWLVLRQEALDFKEGFKWNQIVHREPSGVGWANPNLDVVYSDAWIAVDEKSCTLIELPEIKGRYYTVQALNGWGEVTANINERNYRKHPFGKFAFCLKGAKNILLPKGTQRVDLPSRKSRILMRIELDANPADAIALQQKVTMKATGSPLIDPAAVKPDFPNSKLLGVEGFDKTEEILESEADINVGMIDVRDKTRAVAKAAADPSQRARIDDVIRKYAIPAFQGEIQKIKATNGWVHPRFVGNYRTDYVMRSIANYTGIWANNSKEVVYFAGQGLDGSQTYTQTYPKDALPGSKTRYFWSVIAVDGVDYKVIPNPLNRYLLNKQSPLKLNDDGSLTLAFAPKQPDGIPDPNWLPTLNGKKYNLTYRFYGPTKDVSDGTYYPPPLVRISETETEKFIRSLKKSTTKMRNGEE